MALKLDSLRRDIKAETDGEWREVLEHPGVRLLVRGLNYPQYKVARTQLIQRFARKYGKKPVPPAEDAAESGRILADHILLGWDGLDVPYSADAAREELMRADAMMLRDMVYEAAREVGEERVEFVGAAVGN